MKLSTREDIEAPIGTVYAVVSDFASIERQLQLRGVMIDRDPAAPPSGEGRRWSAQATWRGRAHVIDAELVSQMEDRGYEIVSMSGGVYCTTVVDLVALSRTRTRLLVSLDLRPTTLSSRLLVQSLKLAKGRLTDRLALRLAEVRRRIEAGG